ncbi:MAG: lipoyl synthase [candidate division KSB1 bacterium]|nr:lipoyl synthase [candidate division KSB1 bacterium]
MDRGIGQEAAVLPKPHWLKIRLPGGEHYTQVKSLVSRHGLHTVCQSAQCPNLGECWSRGTATMMILGNVCTRNCRFCAVESGRPLPPDADEPRRVAEAVAALSLRYAVITSVTRDDLPDGGAEQFAAVIREIRLRNPECLVEVLIPDFKGDEQALNKVFSARPDVLNHNLETVPRLYPQVRPQADYGRSLAVLQKAAAAGLRTKSGLMVGLGETLQEVIDVLQDLYAAGCRMVTVGQYLQPSKSHLPVERYVSPQEFDEIARVARQIGFEHAECGPLVRSSYHAEEQLWKSR